MNKVFLIFSILFSSFGFAQVTESFADGDFTSSPVWSGDAVEFTINASNQLQLNATIAGASYLSTPNVMANLDNKEWRCYVKQTFAGSGSNYGRVYLVSDQANLEGPLNGYYLQFGEALGNDAIELFEQTGTVSTSVCRGTNAQIAASFTVGVQVKRNAAGLWTLSVDGAGGTNYIQEATGTNTTHTTSSFMGVADVFTVGNITKFFYDDFYAGAIITDVAPPTIVSATVISSTQLDVLFNEDLDVTSSQVTSNYSANNALGAPSTAVLDGINAKLVHLTWATAFTNGLQNTLTVNGVQDIATNPISNGTVNFTLLSFSTPTYKDVIINELMVDVSPAPTGVPARQYLELYNKSSNYFDLNGWKFADAATTTTIASSYTLAPNSYVLIAKSSDTVLFVGLPNKIGTATFPGYNLSGDPVILKDNSNTTIDSISYTTAWYHDGTKSGGGWSLELINPILNPNCDPTNNWAASTNANGGTPGVQNSVYSLAADAIAPQISSTTVVDSVTLTICFNEAIDASLISNSANYVVNNAIGNPLSATASNGNTCVTLVFATAFTSQLSNTITISNLADCSGNVVSPNTSNFTYVRIDVPQFGEVILTEIMIDVNPVPAGVPAKQYIELYNTTNKYFNLNGCQFADAAGTSTINTSYTLGPNSYVLIAKNTDTALFAGITNKIGTSTFPSYNITGDPVYIYDNVGNILDSIRYTQAWYNDAVKDDGGWSLELINPTASAACVDQTNWTASNSVNGGTPGVQNSVYSTTADVTAPQISSTTVVDSVTVTICFNEAINSTLISNVSNYSVTNSIGSPISATASNNNTCVTLVFATSFTSQLSNTITISNLADCSGNLVSSNTSNFTYVRIDAPQFGEIILTEIMVDVNPIPTGVPAKQYIELYNTTTKYFNLNGFQFADAATTSTVTTSYILSPNAYVLIARNADTSLFTGITNKIGTTTFPVYNSTGDPVFIYDNVGNILDSIRYTTAWYNDAVKDDGGWSLELINPTASSNCVDQSNWTASSNLNGGTPGVQNSVYSTAADVTAPLLISTTVIDSVTLTVCFNEAISASLISNIANYSVNNAIGSPLSATASNSNTCVTLVFANAFTSQLSNTITFTLLADCSGNLVTPASSSFTYVRVDNPLFGEIILTEIMVDVNPIPALVPAKQYIELYNTTNKYFNLNGYQFADAATTSTISNSYILAPNNYVLIARNTDTSLFTGITNKIGTSTFPVYNTTGDPVFIYDNAGNILDSIRYTQAWYNDVVKDDGGWSLELINPTASSNCVDQSNWTATSNADGGTPGVQNSVYSIAADITAPMFSNISVIDSVTIQICFNEAISASLVGVITNYSVNGGIGNPIAVAVNSTFTCATLSFLTPFTSQTTYTLNFATLADCSGNNVSTGTASFTYIRTDNPIAGDVIVTELMIDVNPVPAALPAKQYVELYNKSSKYFNLNNWQLSDRVGSIVINQNYILAPNAYVLVTRASDTALFVGVTNKIGTSSLPAYNTTGDGVYLQDNFGNFIDTLNYTDSWYNNPVKDDGGWSLELINPTLNANCDATANWTSTNNASGGTPGAQNSVYTIAPDVTAPVPQYVSVTDSLHITVCFNEAISANLISTATNYSVSNGIGNPINAIISTASTKCIDLVLPTPLQNQTNYTLTLTNLSDCSGNAVNPASVAFSYYLAKPYDVVINELFPDPDPQVALPQGEYVELFNRTNFSVSLKNWTLTVGNHDIVIPDAVIQPDSFVVLIGSPALNSFINEGYGNRAIVVVAGMASSELNVSDEDVVLKDASGTVISLVHYYDSWYQDATKKPGGWSLEQIDPSNPCAGQSNWRASNNANGGTPGAKNSIDGVNADTQLPQISKVNIIDKDTIVLVFNESIQYSTMTNASIYSINNGIGIPVSVAPKAMEYKQITLVLPNSLQVNTSYTITVSGTITDCAGNSIAANSKFVFGRPDTLLPGDLLINEVMFAPKTGGIDYVELYNNSSKILDLKDLYIGEGSTTSTLIQDSVQVTNDGYIIFPGEYVLLSENGATVKSQYSTQNPNWFLDMTDLPSMNSDQDNVVIANINGVEIDKLDYTSTMHFALLNDTKGVSLERIDFTRPASDKTNWNSASINVGFGTPAYKNSQYMLTQGTGSFSVVPEIFSPDNDGYNDVVTINYEVGESGLAGNVSIYNSDGQFVRYLARNENLATKGSYSWNGITEQNEKAPIGIYVIYFETFNKDGKVEKHKLSCVLAGKL